MWESNKLNHFQSKPLSQSALAVQDLIEGFCAWRIWFMLAWQDIKLRYRRSYLGPFWITISMAIMIYSMGFLYGKLFKADLAVYYPFLACGLVSWTMIATTVVETSDTFSSSAGFIKQIKLPYSVYILRTVTRNFIIFFHNLLAIVPILIYFNLGFSLVGIFGFIYGVLLLFMFGFTFGMIFSIVGTRFMDIKQIISSLIQIVFLLTPIMWMPYMLPERFGFMAAFNPFYQVINLIREPLTGHVISLFTFVYTLLLLGVGMICMFILLRRARRRIAFWV